MEYVGNQHIQILEHQFLELVMVTMYIIVLKRICGIAVGRDPTSNSILYSTNNGISWNTDANISGSVPFGTCQAKSVHYSNDRWVVVGDDDTPINNNILYSDDGVSWFETKTYRWNLSIW